MIAFARAGHPQLLHHALRSDILRIGQRDELWHGNVEPPLWTVFTDRDHVVRWAWATHHKSPVRVAALRRERPGLCVVRLRGRDEVRRWLAGPLRAAAALPPPP